MPFLLGLPNKGNTCFINAVLVSLFNAPKMMELVCSESLEKLFNNKAMVNQVKGLELLKQFSTLLNASYRNDQLTINKQIFNFLRSFYDESQKNNGGFQEGTQDDASSFMINLINWLLNSIEQTPLVFPNYREATMNASLLLKDYLLSIKEITICSYGHQFVSYTEELLQLSININDTDLNEVIKRHFDAEHFPSCKCHVHGPTSNCNAFYCSTCKKHVAATRKCKITRMPNVLILTFKLFSFHNNQVIKLNI